MEFIIVVFVLLILGIKWVVDIIQGVRGKSKRNSKYSSNQKTYHFNKINQQNNILPNGYSRQEYYDYGYSDFDIEYWGLRQPGAPSPPASGLIVADMVDGEIDGDIDFLD